MNIYISLLRGINVAGKAQIKMTALRAMYEALGFDNVTTYIQSGNVIFGSTETNTSILGKQISAKIEADFGHRVPVTVLTPGELAHIAKQNPFPADPSVNLASVYVTFLAQKPAPFDPSVILDKKKEQEQIVFTDQAVYFYSPTGYGTTKLDNNFLEKKLKVTATTRNWKTTLELIRLAGGGDEL